MNCRAPWETPNRPGVKPCVEMVVVVLDVVDVDAVGDVVEGLVVTWMEVAVVG